MSKWMMVQWNGLRLLAGVPASSPLHNAGQSSIMEPSNRWDLGKGDGGLTGNHYGIRLEESGDVPTQGRRLNLSWSWYS